VDGLVLGVILEKVPPDSPRSGHHRSVPEDSRTVLDTVAKALLFNPNRTVKAISDKNQLKLGLEDFAERATPNSASRIKSKKPRSVRRRRAQSLLTTPSRLETWRLIYTKPMLPLATWLLSNASSPAHSPNFSARRLTAQNRLALAHRQSSSLASRASARRSRAGCQLPFADAERNTFTRSQSCRSSRRSAQFVMARSLAREPIGRAARAAVMRTREVTTKTTLLLFRCRNVIGEKDGVARMSREMLFGAIAAHRQTSSSFPPMKRGVS